MPSKLALERSFVFDTSAHLPFPPAVIRRCLLAAIDVTVLSARAGQVREPAVGQPDLPPGRPLRAGDQPPQDLALDADRSRQRRVADGDPGGRGVNGAGR
jgi:hypothetical protein